MNNQRRKAIKLVIDNVYDAMRQLQSIADDQLNAYYNIPKSIRNSQRCVLMHERIENLADVTELYCKLTTALEHIICEL